MKTFKLRKDSHKSELYHNNYSCVTQLNERVSTIAMKLHCKDCIWSARTNQFNFNFPLFTSWQWKQNKRNLNRLVWKFFLIFVTINCVTQLNERESLQQRSSCISSVRGCMYDTSNYTKLIVNMIWNSFERFCCSILTFYPKSD